MPLSAPGKDTGLAPDTPPAELILASLERILASEGFAGSAQLSRFLRYVVEKGLPGMITQLKESIIGVSVFNRGPSYDPKTDPVVRVEARRLRARLDAYYEGPGAADPVRISLPKGGYVPSFEWIHSPVPEPAVEILPLPAPVPAIKSQFRRRWIVLPLATALIGLIALAILRANAPERTVTRFWSSILESDRPALLIPADSGLVMLQNLAQKPVTLREYMTGEYRAHLSSQSPLDPNLVYNLAGRRYTSIADLEFASRLTRRPEAAKRGLITRYARDVRVEDLKQRNVILLGARMSNPWVELFEKSATFRLDDDSVTGAMKVVNLSPQPNEPREFAESPAEMDRETYSIVTYHRTQGSNGLGLVVAGMTVAGTEAAADFLLDDSRMLPWLRKAEAAGEITGFDLLLHARNLAGSSPRADVVLFHLR